MSLAFAPLNIQLKIVKINAEDKVKKHLENLGFVIGSTLVSILDSKSDLILKVKGSKVALNKSLALKIMVA
ncbi:MAG: ferrous iron transport protein A [Clostridiales bacterium]|nr:ferrous iron transport protein A [Clostridiales bacterium]